MQLTSIWCPWLQRGISGLRWSSTRLCSTLPYPVLCQSKVAQYVVDCTGVHPGLVNLPSRRTKASTHFERKMFTSKRFVPTVV